MSTTAASGFTTSTQHAHAARRRGFGIVSRLSRGSETPRHLAEVSTVQDDLVVDSGYEPRHRREDAQSSV